MLGQAALRGVPVFAPPPAGGTTYLFQSGAVQAAASFSRASTATLKAANGTFSSFSVDAPRIDNSDHILIMPAATEHQAYSTDPTQYSSQQSGVVTSEGSTGVLIPGSGASARVASSGSATSGAKLSDKSGIQADEVWIQTVFYEAGTSGELRYHASSFAVLGDIGSSLGFSNWGGTFSVSFTDEIWSGAIRRLDIQATALTNTSLSAFLGPNSTTAGEDIIIHGASLRRQQANMDLEWIETAGSAVTRAADVLTHTPPAAQDIKLIGTAADGTVYTAGAPLIYANQTTEWTCPAGRWSEIWAEDA